jgi:hypothetical protein
MPPGPDTRVKITKEYARHVARDAFFWAWPMVNVYNKRLGAEQSKELAYAGPVPAAPLNRIVMLMDYVAADERIVACPNQDVVYGGGSLGLEASPVVVQVPEFGDRFWVYQAVDLRTDGFARIGKMYGTTPGFYLLAGPNWHESVPEGITEVFRSSTNTGFIAPRIFMDDTAQDRKAIQPLLQQIMLYPLAEYDGKMKTIDWNTIRKLPNPASGEQEMVWVPPESFVDTLPVVLGDAPPLPGEEARYAQVLAVLDAARNDPQIKAAMTEGAKEADEQLVKPLLQFRNYGQTVAFQLEHDLERSGVRYGLLHAHRGGEVQHFRECPERDEVLLSGSRQGRRPPQWVQPLHRDLCQGPDSARQRLLVADSLQRAPLLRSERDGSLFSRYEEQGSQDECRRFADHLRAGRSARASLELAACPQRRRLLALPAHVLAEGCRHGRFLDAAGGGDAVRHDNQFLRGMAPRA